MGLSFFEGTPPLWRFQEETRKRTEAMLGARIQKRATQMGTLPPANMEVHRSL